MAIILKEPEAELAVATVRDRVRTRRERVVPDLFWYEIANVLMRRHGLSSLRVVEAIHQLEQFGLRTVHPERSTRASSYLAELRARARAGATERATAAGRAAPGR